MENENARSKDIPQVFLLAKKNVEAKIMKAVDHGKNDVYDKGPWDQGHWANRK